MYDTGEDVRIGDVVRRGSEEGTVLEVVPSGIGGQENAKIQWSRVIEISPGIWGYLAPVQDLTRGLTLVRRKA